MKRIVTLCALLLPSLAFAHPGHGITSVSEGVVAGLLHPLMGLDHLLAITALGVLLYKVNKKQALLIGGSFLTLLAVGFYGAQASVFGFSGDVVESAILFSVILSISFVALSRVVKANVSALLVTGFALFHGIAHGVEVPVGASSHGFALGFLMSCAALIVISRTMMLAVSAVKLKFTAQV